MLITTLKGGQKLCLMKKLFFAEYANMSYQLMNIWPVTRLALTAVLPLIPDAACMDTFILNKKAERRIVQLLK
jgi:hypothetical protein